jgi:hemerythrin-like metal-binding protein
MGSLEWKTDFCTGIEEMDKHHKKFFNYLKELEEAAGGNKGRDVIERGLKQVDDYIKYHFAEEEKLMEITGCPELAQQKKQHEFFKAEIAELRDQYSKGNAFVPISTLIFLKEWFLRHILETDKKYGEYLSGIGG